MAPVRVHGLLVLLLSAFTAAQRYDYLLNTRPNFVTTRPPYGENDCCYGRNTFKNGQTVTTLPECCVSLVCVNGNIEPRHFGSPGSSGCCEFDGQMYPEGAELSSYCVTLVCHRGNWTFSQKIEDCCKLCRVYNDPHFVTFDGYRYDWHGTCNYTITQTGRSLYPDVGVFGEFQPCFVSSQASCLRYTTFKNDKHTVITIDHNAPWMFSVLVNGRHYTVPAGVNPVVSSVAHPVLAWRDGDCVFLAGSSRILLRYCRHQLYVWAYPAHTNQLDGLCGHFNFYQNDDMTNRNGTVHSLDPWPEAFPESWKTNDQTDRQCLAPCPYCKETTTSPCRASAADMERYKALCARVLHVVLGRNLDLLHHVDTCAWDLCMGRQSGQSAAERDSWLIEVVKLVTDARLMHEKTAGTFQQQLPQTTGECKAGSRWKNNCNWCTCRTDNTADCSQNACPTNYQHPAGSDACLDNSVWKSDECNWCHCVTGGHICTYKNCTEGMTPSPQTSPSTEQVCFYTYDAGTCPGGLTQLRYYYNYFYGRCATFSYTTCGGNANNFLSEADCLRACGHLTATTRPTTTTTTTSPTTTTPWRPSQCNLQPQKGPCYRDHARYFYNATTSSCELFTYGGCEGNGNNFQSRQECESICRATQVGGSLSTNYTASTYSVSTNRPLHCFMQPQKGPCYNDTERWYFDPSTDTCLTFTYSGCGGNNNNFISKDWCLASCAVTASTIESVSTALPIKCYQDSDVGDCYDALWRWYYKAASHKCEAFVYGGCGGNDNRYLSKEECEAACGGQTQSTDAVTAYGIQVCILPKDPGHCYESLKRYYYNSETKYCEEFTYSGCGGNQNRFYSLEECWTACGF